MKLRELKARVVLDTMVHYAVKYGKVGTFSESGGTPHCTSIIGDLKVLVDYRDGRCHCNIWNQTNGKVFWAIDDLLEVVRCDPGGWFDTISQYLSGNAEANADYLAKTVGGSIS